VTTIDDLGGVWRRADTTTTFLPEPDLQPRFFTIISVDDHLVEPPETFEGRMPKKYEEAGPRVVEVDGAHVWKFEDRTIPNSGTNAVVGRPPREYSFEPTRFDQMRKGAYDVNARVQDMDLAGVWSSMCFPSAVCGFGGTRFSEAKDPELGLAAVRAWNDWHLEDWAGAYPERFIPLQVTWLRDPEVAAADIRLNAERGFRAVSFPDNPEKLGFPSVHTPYWDPVLRACEETGTVLCLHVGSSSSVTTGSSDAPMEVITSLFFAGSLIATVDWLFSKAALRFPELKIAISEGGVGWVPALLDRLEHTWRYQEWTGGWKNEELTPTELLERNFWFCALDDAAGFEMIDRIGSDRVLCEVDYPHSDSNWPYSQVSFKNQFGDLSEEDVERVTWKNAASLFRLELPEFVTSGEWRKAGGSV
jgi:predicted TIM-barrel fold metal-dependent hydrolase